MTPTYPEVLDYLFSRLPMFTRIGKAAYKADLNNTYALMSLLQHPENKFKSIHIAGTNGKGSCSHMLASILQKAGYKTGLYTSPHIKDFRERIRINGEMIGEQQVMHFVEKYKVHFEQIQPSFFEWTVALCFDYFANEQVDIAVIETGLGGRLDSTNVINPEISLITNIGYDHTDLLGDTLGKIASEKAGIIKKNIPIVIGQKHPETENVFIEKAAIEQSKILFASDEYEVQNWKSYNNQVTMDIYYRNKLLYKQLMGDLPGQYQQKNIPMVLAVVKQLQSQGFHISDQNIRDGIATTKSTTGLRGRWEVLQNNPLVIADTGHNEDGIQQIVAQLSTQTYTKLLIVFGMVNDKLPDKVLHLMPKNAEYFFCRADMPRAMDDQLLCELAKTFNLIGRPCGSVQHAYAEALSQANSDDLIFIGGSTFVAAEVL